MNVPDDPSRREIALFRYRIIADLLLLPSGSAGIGAMMQAKAAQEYAIPGACPPSAPALPPTAPSAPRSPASFRCPNCCPS